MVQPPVSPFLQPAARSDRLDCQAIADLVGCENVGVTHLIDANLRCVTRSLTPPTKKSENVRVTHMIYANTRYVTRSLTHPTK